MIRNIKEQSGETTRMHVLLLGRKKGLVIDHKDGNGLNNQKFNLRHCTVQDNAKNRKISTLSSSGFKGVTIQRYKKYKSRWVAKITVDKKVKHLGSFPLNEEGKVLAIKTYNEAAVKYYGEFARLNEINSPRIINDVKLNKVKIFNKPNYTGYLPPNSKAIPLSKGLFAIVSEDDFDFLNQWNWFVKESDPGAFYACRSGKRIKGQKREKQIRMHNFIMNPPLGMFVDHINRNPLDNRRENLRIVTHKQNCMNRRGCNGIPFYSSEFIMSLKSTNLLTGVRPIISPLILASPASPYLDLPL